MITLQFVACSDLGSRAIRWFGGGAFSHVDAVDDKGWLVGARSDDPDGRGTGVQERNPHYEVWTQRVTVNIPAEENQIARFWRFLAFQLGKPYDTTAIWGFVLNRDWRAQDSWFCSELQAAALEDAGLLTVCPYLHVNKITPTDLALMVGALPEATWAEQPCN